METTTQAFRKEDHLFSNIQNISAKPFRNRNLQGELIIKAYTTKNGDGFTLEMKHCLTTKF